VDSVGECLNNQQWEGKKPLATSPFLKMEQKLALMRQYKIVLAFENHNVSDFVTEKLFNVFQAGMKERESERERELKIKIER
jgi:Glycosyltransferase family 10 (fucosyltransferase) C-term